jgi:hypothetical protein
VDEVADAAPPAKADTIRKLREDLLALKLVQRVPQPRPVVWQTPHFWTVMLLLAATLANALGLTIPINKLLGGP